MWKLDRYEIVRKRDKQEKAGVTSIKSTVPGKPFKEIKKGDWIVGSTAGTAWTIRSGTAISAMVPSRRLRMGTGTCPPVQISSGPWRLMDPPSCLTIWTSSASGGGRDRRLVRGR